MGSEIMQLFDTAPVTIKNGWEKHAHEFQTRSDIALFMAKLVPARTIRLLEPTPGMGQLVNAAKARRPHLKITAPADFFQMQPQRFDCILMNPPFTWKYANIKHMPADYLHKNCPFGYRILFQCMEYSDNIIALLPTFTLTDSDTRTRELVKFGLKSITQLPRNAFGYTRVQTSVFELRKGWHKPTIYQFYELIHRKNKKNLSIGGSTAGK